MFVHLFNWQVAVFLCLDQMSENPYEGSGPICIEDHCGDGTLRPPFKLTRPIKTAYCALET